MPPLKLIFAGTPEFAAIALQRLLDERYEVVAVYTQPDRPAGRGRKLQPSPVKQLALEHQIPVEQPENFKSPEALTTLQSYAADLMIVAAYGLLLPESVLTSPRYGCMNIHASLLPRWRGAAPIQRAILAGDAKTGITIMQMDRGLDTGAMLLKRELAITNETAGQLHDALAHLGGEAICEALDLLQRGQLHGEPQDETQANYARKLEKHEAWVDWQQPAELIARQVRAFVPWPVSQSQLDDQIIRIHAAEVAAQHSGKPPGTILAYDRQAIVVQCGEGSLRLLRCQLPGSRAMDVADLHNGHPQLFAPGTCFTQASDT